MTFASVDQFKNWWLKAGRPMKPPFKNCIHTTDIAYAMCLYRKDQFQVELYICKPNTESPVHSHPNVDSISMYLTGDLSFSDENGNYKDLSAYQWPKENGAHMLLGKTADKNNGKPHALRTGSTGGSFLIFERWLKDNPSSVTLHWEGDLVGKKHAQTIKEYHA